MKHIVITLNAKISIQMSNEKFEFVNLVKSFQSKFEKASCHLSRTYFNK